MTHFVSSRNRVTPDAAGFFTFSYVWFWGVSFSLTNRKNNGHATSIDEAKAAFRAEYLAWMGTENGRAG